MPELTLSALGIRFEVATDISDGELDVISEAWSWCPSQLAADDRPPTRLNRPSHGNFEQFADNLVSEITRLAIHARRDDLLMLHACAVVDSAGSVAGFIGPSGRGKTTAAVELAQRFGYVTDETLAIAPDGAVEAYPKPLSVKVVDSGWKEQRSPRSLGLLRAGEPTLLRRLYLLDRDPDGPLEPEVTSMELADVIDVLVPQISYLDHLPLPLQTLQRVIEFCGGLRSVRYREAASLGTWLDNELADVEPTSWPERLWAPAEPADSTHVSDEPVPSARFSRARVQDFIVGGNGRVVVMADRMVRVLDGIGPGIWAALQSPRSLEEIVNHIVEEYGEPPGANASDLVAATLADLVDAGLVNDIQGSEAV